MSSSRFVQFMPERLDIVRAKGLSADAIAALAWIVIVAPWPDRVLSWSTNDACHELGLGANRNRWIELRRELEAAGVVEWSASLGRRAGRIVVVSGVYDALTKQGRADRRTRDVPLRAEACHQWCKSRGYTFNQRALFLRILLAARPQDGLVPEDRLDLPARTARMLPQRFPGLVRWTGGCLEVVAYRDLVRVHESRVNDASESSDKVPKSRGDEPGSRDNERGSRGNERRSRGNVGKTAGQAHKTELVSSLPDVSLLPPATEEGEIDFETFASKVAARWGCVDVRHELLGRHKQLLRDAVRSGWNLDDLETQLTRDRDGARRPVGVVAARLRILPSPPLNLGLETPRREVIAAENYAGNMAAALDVEREDVAEVLVRQWPGDNEAIAAGLMRFDSRRAGAALVQRPGPAGRHGGDVGDADDDAGRDDRESPSSDRLDLDVTV